MVHVREHLPRRKSQDLEESVERYDFVVCKSINCSAQDFEHVLNPLAVAHTLEEAFQKATNGRCDFPASLEEARHQLTVQLLLVPKVQGRESLLSLLCLVSYLGSYIT